MYWLRRPPFLRWIAAGLLVCGGIYLDTRPQPVVAYPFAATTIARGENIDDIVWRDVPAGVLPAWTKPVTGVAASDIPANTPLLPALIADIETPAGWWAVSLPMPAPVAPGTPIRVAVDGRFADGVVAGELTDHGYEITAPVAFPPDQAELVATITADRTPVVMIGK